MHVVTLISPGASAPLPSGLLDGAARLVASMERAWLEPGVACDLFCGEEPGSEARRALAALAWEHRVDCVVQQQENRRKRILIADMDSTMIGQECIDELAAEIGIKEHVAAITARAMNGEIAFEPALRERVALLKGMSETVIGRVIEQRITLAAGAVELVATMRANGAYSALVSGGFTAFTAVVAERLGFNEHRANTLMVDAGSLTGTVREPILGADAKLTALREIAAAKGLSVDDAIAVGDGANDLPMIRMAGTGVAVHAKPAVAASAPHRIDHADLSALLFMQGYRREEFVR